MALQGGRFTGPHIAEQQAKVRTDYAATVRGRRRRNRRRASELGQSRRGAQSGGRRTDLR
jgi:hypothetical protein